MSNKFKYRMVGAVLVAFSMLWNVVITSGAQNAEGASIPMWTIQITMMSLSFGLFFLFSMPYKEKINLDPKLMKAWKFARVVVWFSLVIPGPALSLLGYTAPGSIFNLLGKLLISVMAISAILGPTFPHGIYSHLKLKYIWDQRKK